MGLLIGRAPVQPLEPGGNELRPLKMLFHITASVAAKLFKETRVGKQADYSAGQSFWIARRDDDSRLGITYELCRFAPANKNERLSRRKDREYLGWPRTFVHRQRQQRGKSRLGNGKEIRHLLERDRRVKGDIGKQQSDALFLERGFHRAVTHKQKVNIGMTSQEVSRVKNVFEAVSSAKRSCPQDDSLPLEPETLFESGIHASRLKKCSIHAIRQEKYFAGRNSLGFEEALPDPFGNRVHIRGVAIAPPLQGVCQLREKTVFLHKAHVDRSVRP